MGEYVIIELKLKPEELDLAVAAVRFTAEHLGHRSKMALSIGDGAVVAEPLSDRATDYTLLAEVLERYRDGELSAPEGNDAGNEVDF